MEEITLTLTKEEATRLKSILYAISTNFKRYRGMNIGSSEVHNLFRSDAKFCADIADKIG